MCGDVGFPDKIFRCINCNHRFQHWYCSNYYNASSEPMEQCDWCLSDEIKTSKHRTSSKKPTSKLDAVIKSRPEYSGDKIKREHGDSRKGKSPTRSSTRRYKLLKDVMSC
ncbi:hypothetical protein L1987_56643 [Smallanthus sonchifolius]|uniref:Uncharacterized protein n=1 Tax=Smallanthus sonchifolius TaxID=185202 RepID=A0ACB9EDQ1_9ASTR|nr:hypothetical protein L1987_56643 [Smallanthus sonchifolius]